MSDEPKLGPAPSPAVPLMAPEKARDIARGLKGLADAYADAQMQRQAAAALRDSEWWLRYALTLEATSKG
jgi:hypothetical protein